MRTLTDFLETPFAGLDAPDRFLAWLAPVSAGTGQSWAPVRRTAAGGPTTTNGGSFVERLRPEDGFDYYGGSEERERALLEIERWISGDAGAGRVLAVHAPGMAMGMSALAARIWSRASPLDPRPWCYLPVSRGPGSDIDPTYRATVARLAAWFRGRNPAEADPDDASESTEDRLSFCRAKIAENPIVLLLDGYQEPVDPDAEDRTPHLSRLVRDEPIALMLEHLLRPRVDVIGGRRTSPGFDGTRIVVFGNSRVTPLGDRCVPLSEPFPPFPRSDLLPLLRGCEWTGSATICTTLQ